jgi:hypothetical protein
VGYAHRAPVLSPPLWRLHGREEGTCLSTKGRAGLGVRDGSRSRRYKDGVRGGVWLSGQLAKGQGRAAGTGVGGWKTAI